MRFVIDFIYKAILLTLFRGIFSDALIDWNFGPESNNIFHAYVVEKTQEVLIHPPLNVQLSKGSQLCRLHLVPTATHSVPPFISPVVLDSEQGVGGLTFNESLLYTTRRHAVGARDPAVQGMGVYHLKVFAEDCSHPSHSTRPWTINIVLIPTESPVWSTNHYQFRISSQLAPGAVVGKVTAYAALGLDERPGERDGDDTGMCSYAVDDPGHSYFDVDGHGTIRSRLHFDKWSHADYEFNVTGFDCVIPVANRATVSVSVHVQPGCVAGWRNLPELFDYQLISSNKEVMPKADFELCQSEVTTTSSTSCDLEKATLRAKLLWTRQDVVVDGVSSEDEYASGMHSLCDLEVMTLKRQRERCGIQSRYTENLMNPGAVNKFASAVHSFNGTNQLPLRMNQQQLVAPEDHRLDNTWFTLTFWMNHTVGPVGVGDPQETFAGENSGKETVLCTSDNAGKNRHHFTIFLHNCKLTVLLRHEPEPSAGGVGRSGKPLYLSQWRFVLDEVCDNAWHHYALVHHGDVTDMKSANQLELYLDGVRIAHEPDVVQLAEDYALAAVPSDQHNLQPTRMTIGACWHGRESKYQQHFHGELADLILHRGVILTPEQIRCLSSCLPELHATAPQATTAAHLPSNSDPVGQVVIEATGLKALVSAARQMVFYSPRLYYIPQSRPEAYAINVNTVLKFKSSCRKVSIPDHTIHFNRQPPEQEYLASIETTPRLSLSLFNPQADRYSKVINISTASLAHGVSIFPSVELRWKPDDSLADTQDRRIDYCQLSLCQANTFALGESVVVGPEVLTSSNAVSLTTYPGHVTLTGPSAVQHMTKAITSLQWRWDKELAAGRVLPETRCFRLFCAARQLSGPDLHSPVIQAVFAMRGLDEPLSVTVNRALQKSMLQSSLRDENLPPSGPESRMTLWEYNSPLYYMVFGVALTILVVCIVIGTIYICRSNGSTPARRLRSPNRSPSPGLVDKLKDKLAPIVQFPSQKKYNPQANRHTKPGFGRLLMSINPMDAAHQSEVDDFQKKQCYYDRERYDDYGMPTDGERQHPIG